MKKYFIFLFIVVSIASSQTKDVMGWRETKWGLNESEILNLFSGEVIRLNKNVDYDDMYASLGIINYEILSYKFDVHFIFGKSTNKLEGINIQAKEETLRAPKVAYSQLEQLLDEKYGNPSFRDEKKNIYSHKIAWFFPSTTIELYLLSMPEINKNVLIISYRMPSKDLKKF